MKKNVATMVLKSVEKESLINVLTQYLPENALESLAYHFSDDEPLTLSVPEYDETKIIEFFMANNSYNSVSNVRASLDAFDQRIYVYYTYTKTRWYISEEEAAKAPRWGGSDKEKDEYVFPGEYKDDSNKSYSVKEFVEKFGKLNYEVEKEL